MEVQRDTGILAGRTMTQPQQHYDVTDDDFDFIWKNIDSPLVVRDRINVIKTRSHPYQSERDKVLNNKLASRYKALLVHCMDTIEDIRRKYTIAPKSCKSCSAYDLCEELRQAGEP